MKIKDEYVRVSNLTRLRIIQSILFNLSLVDNKGDEVIKKSEYGDVYKKVTEWIDKHEK